MIFLMHWFVKSKIVVFLHAQKLIAFIKQIGKHGTSQISIEEDSFKRKEKDS